MEAGTAAQPRRARAARPAWLLGLAPLVLIAAAIATFAALGAPGLGDRRGPAVEELVVERTVLEPGLIELTVRNDGPDAVQVAQVTVNDRFVDFSAGDGEVGRLGAERIAIPYPWIEGEAYEVGLLTATGGVIGHPIDVAVETPGIDLSFFALMALLGIYVGVIPVGLGMLWLPFVRRIAPEWLRAVMAVTIGLLLFLALDALLEGIELAGTGPQAFGGAGLVLLGAGAAYLALAATDAHMRARRASAQAAGAAGATLALLVAIGIGLHNLGEGIAIGSSYAVGALALGAFLVVGFAIHNTTEGLAIVAPLGGEGTRPPLRRLALLGLVAGGPAVVGAWIGAAAFTPALAALLLGVGVGAIVQVVQQLAPTIRDGAGRLLHPLSVGGILAGLAVMYLTSLLVSG